MIHAAISWLIIFAPALYAAIVWRAMPEKVAVHYNIRGEADRYGSKSELISTIVVLMVINVALYILLMNAHRINPRKNSADVNKVRMQRLATVINLFLTGVLCIIIYLANRPG